jgi:hypothetical protein
MANNEIDIRVKVDSGEIDRLNQQIEKLVQQNEKAVAAANKVAKTAKIEQEAIERLKTEYKLLTSQIEKSGGTATQAQSKRLKEISADLTKLQSASGKTGGALGFLTKSFDALGQGVGFNVNMLKGGWVAAAAAVIAGAVALGKAALNAAREWQVLQAKLTSSLGSMEAANAALSQIKEVAAQTPFAVKDIADAFSKLSGAGMIATKDELISLTDLASSQSKSIDQLAEAVIDARRGEFERLKEFGVQASKSGNQVELTFKGVTKTVQNNALAIEEAIIGFGKMEGVAGTNAKVAATLEGAISNLGDAWDEFLRSLGGGGTDAAISVVRGLADAITFLTNAFSGNSEATSGFSRVVDAYKSYYSDIFATFKELYDTFKELNDAIYGYLIDGAKTVFSVIETVVGKIADFLGLGELFNDLVTWIKDVGASIFATTDPIRILFDVISRIITVFKVAFIGAIQRLIDHARLLIGVIEETKVFLNKLGASFDIDPNNRLEALAERSKKKYKELGEQLVDTFTRPLGALTEFEKRIASLNNYLSVTTNNLEKWLETETDLGELQNSLWREKNKLAQAELALNQAKTDEEKKLAEVQVENYKKTVGLVELRVQKVAQAEKQIADERKKAWEEQLKRDKEGYDQLEKLRQENAINSLREESERSKLSIETDKANALKELKQKQYSAELEAKIRFELERKANIALTKLQEEETKKRLAKELEDKLFYIDKNTQETIAAIQHQVEVEELTAIEGQKQITNATKDGLEKQLEARRQVYEEMMKANIYTQEQILAAQKEFNKASMALDDFERAEERKREIAALNEKKAFLALEKETGAADKKISAILAEAEANKKKAATTAEVAKIEVSASKEVTDVRIDGINKEIEKLKEKEEIQRKSGDLIGALQTNLIIEKRLKERAALYRKNAEELLEIQEKTGVDLTDTINKQLEEANKADKESLKVRVESIQTLGDDLLNYASQAFDVYNQIATAFEAAEQRKIDAAKEASDKRLALAQGEVDFLQDAYENSTKKDRKEISKRLKAAEQRAEEEKKIQADLEAEKERLAKEAFNRQKIFNIAQAIMSGALAVIKALAEVPFPANIAVAAGIGVTTAAQIATISAQQFATGTDEVRGRGYGRDTVPALLEPGEAVIKRSAAIQFRRDIQDMNAGRYISSARLKQSIYDNVSKLYAINSSDDRLLNELRAINRKLDKEKPTVSVNADINGFSIAVEKGISRHQRLGSRYNV